MNTVLRFWMLIGSGALAALSFSYLFLALLTYLGPDVSLVMTETNGRLVVMGTALASLAVFVWAFGFAGEPPETNPGERG
ncbi:hypothetical protein [Halovenus salina]|uniref:Uncharacterized protein n=1 Tax=Halovenus salina TaxID=1510225 RepID=A0ABD5W119_9EURY|nr:hypothetical protein [Halovenus salina]